MRKAWPVFILAAVVGVPAAVEGHKGPSNGGSGGQKGGSGQGSHAPAGNHQGNQQGNKGGVSVKVSVSVNVGSVTPFGSSGGSRPTNSTTPKSTGNSSTKQTATN